jgi:hypothetical protein
MFTVNKNPNVKDLRKFGGAMLIGFGVLGVLLWLVPWFKTGDVELLGWNAGSNQIIAVCFWAIGLVLGMVSWSSPKAARPVYVAWMSVAVPIGIVVSTVMLTLLFVVLLPFFSIIARWQDPLRKRRHSGDTYWEDYKPHEATLERTARPF